MLLFESAMVILLVSGVEGGVWGDSEIVGLVAGEHPDADPG